jgi:8-oxo-dGTP pyrophosphatase MutT (NUDIX family)
MKIMRQMYKIYINETQIILTNNNSQNLLLEKHENSLVGIYDGKVKTLFRYIDLAEKTSRYPEIIITYPDLKVLKKDFKSLFRRIRAGGGVVFNEVGEILVIFRRGSWDLPKGKIEKGEDNIEGAKREVKEETGIKDVKAENLICKTYHVYKESGKRILKKTYWYKMQTNKQKLIPQIEEDIEITEWMYPDNFLKKEQLFKNIRDVINKVISND